MPELERRIVELRNGKRYCIVGPDMCVDFHVTDLETHDPIAGLEAHYRKRPAYMRDRPADFDKCWLTGEECWCDGTSLYATEWLLPMFDPKDIDGFWMVLEDEWHKRHKDAFGD